MTLILNSHYVWRLLKMESSLELSDTFQHFRSRLNPSSSFENFLWQAVHAPFPNYTSTPFPALPLDAEFKKGRKNRRRGVECHKPRAYFNSEEGREERRRGTHVPVKIQAKNARFCRYCSVTKNSKAVNGGRVTKRTGRRARTQCSVCHVTLCTSIPSGSNDHRTCFEKWHSRRRL